MLPISTLQTMKLLICMALLVVILVCFYEVQLMDSDLNSPYIQKNDTKPRMTVSFRGRSGNHMFEYASLLGMAKRNNMTPVMVETTSIVKCFKLKVLTEDSSRGYKKYKEKLAAGYSKEFEHLETKNTYIDGFLQSWKYFENVKKTLRQHFVFHDHIQKKASKFLLKAKADHKMIDPVLVGVHIRRGDFVRKVRSGYGAATVSYLYRAMNHFLKKYKNVLFIVCSNDMIWSRKVLDAENYNIQYSNATDSFVDLAILSNCQHAIITVGSFSWWAGFLTGGDVVYYKNFPLPHTSLADQFVRPDYYPPSWIPM